MQLCSIVAFLLVDLFQSPTNIFAPASTPAQSILDLSIFVLEVTAAIFVVVFSLLWCRCSFSELTNFRGS
jgi:hypothetical protein